MNIAYNNVIIVVITVKILFSETVINTHIQLFKTILLENIIADNIGNWDKDFSVQPQIPTTTILIQLNPATVSLRREPIPYICGLRTRIECEPLSEHSTRK